MRNELLKYLNQKKLICIYCDNDTQKFLYGRIIGVDEESFAVEMISPDGLYDGILIKKIDDIIRIHEGGQYDLKMKKLLSADNEYPVISFDNCDVILSLLRYTQEYQKIVSIELINSGYDDIYGFVEEISEQKCKLKIIDEYGYNDGYSYILLSDITQIECDSSLENRIHKLWAVTESEE